MPPRHFAENPRALFHVPHVSPDHGANRLPTESRGWTSAGADAAVVARQPDLPPPDYGGIIGTRRDDGFSGHAACSVRTSPAHCHSMRINTPQRGHCVSVSAAWISAPHLTQSVTYTDLVAIALPHHYGHHPSSFRREFTPRRLLPVELIRDDKLRGFETG